MSSDVYEDEDRLACFAKVMEEKNFYEVEILALDRLNPPSLPASLGGLLGGSATWGKAWPRE